MKLHANIFVAVLVIMATGEWGMVDGGEFPARDRYESKPEFALRIAPYLQECERKEAVMRKYYKTEKQECNRRETSTYEAMKKMIVKWEVY